jgi:hypothetical protein
MEPLPAVSYGVAVGIDAKTEGVDGMARDVGS